MQYNFWMCKSSIYILKLDPPQEDAAHMLYRYTLMLCTSTIFVIWSQKRQELVTVFSLRQFQIAFNANSWFYNSSRIKYPPPRYNQSWSRMIRHYSGQNVLPSFTNGNRERPNSTNGRNDADCLMAVLVLTGPVICYANARTQFIF